MKTLKDIKGMKGKIALVRVDYNVPMKEGVILDTRRIDASFDTIKAIQKKGLQVRLLAHLGDGSQTLKPVASYLAKYFSVKFVTENITEPIGDVQKNTVILFENIRRYPQEEKNDPKFAKVLSKLGDIFVNDAFSVSHRKHTSIVGVAKCLPAFAGAQLENEIKELSKIFKNKKHPFLFILGGAKFETKIPLLNTFIEKVDSLVITGAILNSFYKTVGFEVGASVVEDGYEKQIKKILSSKKILLPVDVIVLQGSNRLEVPIRGVASGDVIVDIGAESVKLISEKIKKAKVVVWNGPTGWYEKGFVGATVALAQAIKSSKAKAVIGGGDTGAVIEKLTGGSSHQNKNLFISTGGGATLDYLAKGSLIGIECLK